MTIDMTYIVLSMTLRLKSKQLCYVCRKIDFGEAIFWYQKAVAQMEDAENSSEFDSTMETPVYQLQAKMAELYLSGGEGLDKDPSGSGTTFGHCF